MNWLRATSLVVRTVAPQRRVQSIRSDVEASRVEALREMDEFYQQFGPAVPEPIRGAHAEAVRRFKASRV